LSRNLTRTIGRKSTACDEQHNGACQKPDLMGVAAVGEFRDPCPYSHRAQQLRGQLRQVTPRCKVRDRRPESDNGGRATGDRKGWHTYSVLAYAERFLKF